MQLFCVRILEGKTEIGSVFDEKKNK